VQWEASSLEPSPLPVSRAARVFGFPHAGTPPCASAIHPLLWSGFIYEYRRAAGGTWSSTFTHWHSVFHLSNATDPRVPRPAMSEFARVPLPGGVYSSGARLSMADEVPTGRRSPCRTRSRCHWRELQAIWCLVKVHDNVECSIQRGPAA
jgi:hypothetical protein